MSAINMLPRPMRTPAVARIVAALERGETLMLPSTYALTLGSVTGCLASLARVLRARVIVCDAVSEVTTRERVYA